MKLSEILSHAALMVGAVAISGVSTTSAFAKDSSGSGTYGAAPASLDYPVARAQVGASKMSKEDLLAMQREELYFLSFEDPFPASEKPYHPLTGKKVDAVLYGPAFKTRSYGPDVDFYRYVTFYNISTKKTRIYEFPTLYEECDDRGELFGSHTFSHSYSASVKASVSFEGLGLESSFTDTRTFTTTRNINATGGIEAEHVAYWLKQDWEGQTFIEFYSKKNHTTSYLTKESEGSSWWVRVLFPELASEKYPYDFEVTDADWTMKIERRIIRDCNTIGFNNYVPADAKLLLSNSKPKQ